MVATPTPIGLTIFVRSAVIEPGAVRLTLEARGGLMSFLGEVVTAQQAAEHCKVSRALIDYWRTTGKLAPIGRYGRSRLYRLADVIALELDMRDHPQSRRREPIPA